MAGLNLHGIVRSVITAVHPDEDCTLYQSAGQKNVLGVVTTVYNPPQAIKANWQPLDSQTLQHLERIGDTKASEQVFLYSNTDMPVSGVQRVPVTRTGDIIKRWDGTYWLITSVIEDWSARGWANVGVTEQVTPPDFSASDWSDSSDT